jgi:hypothetical protein
MHPRDVLAGWCERCGKTLPRPRRARATTRRRRTLLAVLALAAAAASGFLLYGLGSLLLR